MQISDLLVHPIAIADPPLRSSYGLHAPYALRTILELKTTDGLTGIAETYGGDAQLAAFDRIRPLVLGRDPFQLHALWQSLIDDLRPTAGGDRTQMFHVPGENPLDLPNRLFAALEIACLDVIGKVVGKPACDLLGGRVRDAVEFSAYLFYKHGGGGGTGEDAREDEYGECLDPASMVRQCRQMIDRYGFREIKLKAGVLDPDVEVETIRQLRQEFGTESPLRLDPNCAWKLETSLEIARQLREELSGGGYLEDPTPTLEGMSQLRKAMLGEGIGTPLASNVLVTNFADVVKARDLDAVQVVLSDPHYWGGLKRVQQLSFFCETLKLGLSMHSNSHLGVSMMAMTHAAAAAPHLYFACDTHYPWQTGKDDVVVGGRVPIVNGCVRIPDKPGLGVDLDYDQIARGTERYHSIPYKKRDDEAEMRAHVDPDWKRILPRW
jgi:glucarate dehydratase